MRNNFRNILAIIFSLLLFTVIALSLPNKILWGSEVESITLDEFSFSADNDGNCRFGVAVMQQDQLSYLDTLGSGWFLNFGISSGPASNGAEFTPMIRVFQNKSSDGEYLEGYFTLPELTDIGLGSYVDARPGAVWIVGNEVDRGPNPNEPDPLERGQGDTFPDVYAQAYHDVYHFIKSRDPSAKVANSGLVQVTPGRLEYLEQVWD